MISSWLRLVLLIFLMISSRSLLAFQQEISAGATTVAEQLRGTAKKTIAVVDFTDLSGRVTELGRFLAEEFSVTLFTSAKGVTIIDRNHLKALLQEHKLSASGLIDPATAKKLGGIAGADALVTGTLTALGDTVRVVVKVLDTSTSHILAASTVHVAKTRTIEDLLARDLSGQPVSGTAAAVPTTSVPTVRAVEESSGVFENSFVRARFKSLARSGNGQSVSIVLTLENLLKEDLRLALHAEYNPGLATSLMDNRSTEWRQVEVRGIEILRSGYADRDLPAQAASKDAYTLLTAGSRLTVLVRFTTMLAKSEGNTFSFSATALRHVMSQGPERFSIGLHDLSVSSK